MRARTRHILWTAALGALAAGAACSDIGWQGRTKFPPDWPSLPPIARIPAPTPPSSSPAPTPRPTPKPAPSPAPPPAPVPPVPRPQPEEPGGLSPQIAVVGLWADREKVTLRFTVSGEHEAALLTGYALMSQMLARPADLMTLTGPDGRAVRFRDGWRDQSPMYPRLYPPPPRLRREADGRREYEATCWLIPGAPLAPGTYRFTFLPPTQEHAFQPLGPDRVRYDRTPRTLELRTGP